MKRLRWPLLIAVLALAAIGALLLSQQTALLPVVPTLVPATGGEYSEGLVGSLMRLNPVLDFHNPVDRDVDRLIFSGLVRFDDRGLPQGDLAESWGISQDGKVYNFSIRSEATWHDGEPVTSDDVIFTLEVIRAEGFPALPDVKELWKQVEVEGLDEKTLQFRLPEPFTPFLDYLSFGVLPQHLLGGLTPEKLIEAPFNLEPVGSGPYRFERLIVEDGQIAGLVLSAFGDYYNQRPFIEQVVFRYYPDTHAALAAYKNEEVMGIGLVSSDALPEVLIEEGLDLHTGRLPQMKLVFLNLDNPEVPFFQEASIRRALFMGMNRQWMVDRLLGGQAILADGPLFPGTWAYYEGTERVEYDPEAAIDLLIEAGYTIPAEGGAVRAKEGTTLSFELLYPDGEVYTNLAHAIRKDWEQLGIRVDLEAVPYDSLVAEHLEPRIYQAALVDLNFTRTPDPDPYPFWHQAQSTGGQNYAKWDDRLVSEYLEAGRVVLDINERIKMYRNFQVRFSQELPALPLFYPVYSYAVDDAVQGVSMGPLFDPSDRFATVTSWYLLAKRSAQAADPTLSP